MIGYTVRTIKTWSL